MNRGNRKALIFHDDRDRKRFTRILIESAREHGVEILVGTQMGTHFHLIVMTPHANLSAFMQQLESRYANYINWRHGFVGHLFQGPFIAVMIDDDIHLFTAIWYVFFNPCKAGYCTRCQDWPWSTYAVTVGLKTAPSYLSLSWVETLFPAESLQISQRLFRRCMEEVDPIGAYLALDPTRPESMHSYISERVKEMQQPFMRRELTRPTLQQLFPADQSKNDRDSAIRAAKIEHGYTLVEIAKVVELHPVSVSRIFSQMRPKEGRGNVEI
jgi:REP element-mobilizing transposase RayT